MLILTLNPLRLLIVILPSALTMLVILTFATSDTLGAAKSIQIRNLANCSHLMELEESKDSLLHDSLEREEQYWIFLAQRDLPHINDTMQQICDCIIETIECELEGGEEYIKLSSIMMDIIDAMVSPFFINPYLSPRFN